MPLVLAVPTVLEMFGACGIIGVALFCAVIVVMKRMEGD